MEERTKFPFQNNNMEMAYTVIMKGQTEREGIHTTPQYTIVDSYHRFPSLSLPLPTPYPLPASCVYLPSHDVRHCVHAHLL